MLKSTQMKVAFILLGLTLMLLAFLVARRENAFLFSLGEKKTLFG